MIFRFPPTYEVLGPGSFNNYFRIDVSEIHPNPASVGMQEWHQYWNRIQFHILPGSMLICLTIIVAILQSRLGIFSTIPDYLLNTSLVISGAILAVGVILEGKNPFFRKSEMFGQAVEAIYSHRFYGRGIESEMKLAARQMGNSFYRPKLGLTKWTDAEILAELWKIHPKAEGYCDRHVPRFKKFYKYFHVTRGIPVIQDVEIL